MSSRQAVVGCGAGIAGVGVHVRPDEAEILLRGPVRMIPGMERYVGQGHQSVVDGGFYCTAPDNRVLVGPSGPEGVHPAAGLSGYGLMASQAVGDLVAAHILSRPLPGYAAPFLPARLLDPPCLRSLEAGAFARANCEVLHATIESETSRKSEVGGFNELRPPAR